MAQLLLLLGGGLRRALALTVGVVDCCSLEGTLEGAYHVSFFARDYDDSAASRHLEDIVAMMGHRHELGQGWIPEDGVVWHVYVGDVEVNELGTVVLAMSKGEREADLPYRGGGTVVTPEKGLVGWSWSYGT